MTDATDDSGFARERNDLANALARRPNVSERAADAIRAVPRHAFVPEARRQHAYEDRPLPIGGGQTISAPHMVAIMASELDLQPGDKILEVGTGCGYHAAVTAELVGDEHVSTVEYLQDLADRARETLASVGYAGVSIRQGDGHDGWPEHAPYDAAYLTCAATDLPEAVVDQVRAGGVIVAPIGESRQRLVRGVKQADGTLEKTDEGAVRFVQMQGGRED